MSEAKTVSPLWASKQMTYCRFQWAFYLRSVTIGRRSDIQVDMESCSRPVILPLLVIDVGNRISMARQPVRTTSTATVFAPSADLCQSRPKTGPLPYTVRTDAIKIDIMQFRKRAYFIWHWSQCVCVPICCMYVHTYVEETQKLPFYCLIHIKQGL